MHLRRPIAPDPISVRRRSQGHAVGRPKGVVGREPYPFSTAIGSSKDAPPHEIASCSERTRGVTFGRSIGFSVKFA
jgi:hypothetical protein